MFRALWSLVFLLFCVRLQAESLQKARELLADSDLQQAGRFFKAHEKILRKKKPGLLGKWLEQKEKRTSACEVYESDLDKRPCEDGITLRLASCYLQEGKGNESKRLFKRLFDNPTYREIDVMYLPLRHWLQGDDVEWAQNSFGEIILNMRPAALKAPQRERLAEIIALMVDHESPKEDSLFLNKALHRLNIDLPETKATQDVERQSFAQKWLASRTIDDHLARARVLTSLNRNAEVIAALTPYVSEKSDLKKGVQACEMHFLVGKALRRQHRYQQGRDILRRVIKECEGDIRRDAFFIVGRLAAMEPSEQSLLVLNQFLREYPNHSYADDVLLWKISVLEKCGTPKEVNDAYLELFEKYPDGDMVREASFRRAFFSAANGDLKAALERLKSSYETKGEERSHYWYGRLLLYPSLFSLQPNQDAEQRRYGSQLLQQLANDKPNSYYGYWAQRLVDDALRKKQIDIKKDAGVKGKGKKVEPLRVEQSSQLSKNKEFRDAQCLIDAGYDDEAIFILERMVRSYAAAEDRILLAQAFSQINRLDKSHQVMRESGLAFPWHLAYPMAYKKDIEDACKKAGLARHLIFALAREESAFDAQAISWAGARGLCQMMPAVALEEAARLKMDPVSADMLFEPKVNALLSAHHFAHQLRQLEHPLLAIAAYNAGIGNVKKWANQVSDAYPIDVFVEQIPFEETRNYVKKVAGAWMTYAWLDGRLNQLEIPFALQKPEITKAF